MATSGGRGRSGGRPRRKATGGSFKPGYTQQEIRYTQRGIEEDHRRRPAPGEIVPPRRALALDIEQLWNLEGPGGTILIPQYETIGGELGELVKKNQTTPLSNFPTAVRQQWHKVVGPAAEIRRIWKVAHEVTGIHNQIVEKGFPSTRADRGKIRRVLVRNMPAFGKFPRKDSKKKSRTGLLTTAHMIREGKAPNTLTSLKGIYRNIGTRINALYRMQPKILRTYQAALVKADQRKRVYYEWIDRIWEDGEKIHLMSAVDLETTAKKYQAEAASIKVKITPTKKLEGDQIITIFTQAARLLREKRIDQARQTLFAARPWQFVGMSLEHILSSERIRESSTWDRRAGREIIQRQARLFGENIVHWSQGIEPEWMVPWSYGLVNAMRRARVVPKKRIQFERSIRLMENGKFEEAKEEWARALAA